MTHLIGTKTLTACGLDVGPGGDRVTVRWELHTCSACQMNRRDFDAAYGALSPKVPPRPVRSGLVCPQCDGDAEQTGTAGLANCFSCGWAGSC